jgi:hypothetical protein
MPFIHRPWTRTRESEDMERAEGRRLRAEG